VTTSARRADADTGKPRKIRPSGTVVNGPLTIQQANFAGEAFPPFHADERGRSWTPARFLSLG